MTDSMKKCPVHCEATVTIRRFERDTSDIEYYGRVPRPLLEQVLEQQVENGQAREKKRKAAGMNGTRNTHEENCRLSDVDQGSVMSPIVHLVESRAFETLGGIPQLTGRQIGRGKPRAGRQKNG